VSVPNIRDMLMPPYDRSAQDLKIWQQCADLISKQDSRIGAETRVRLE